jgi:hypothetical protein
MESYNFDINPKVNGVTALINRDETSVQGGTISGDHPFSWYHAYSAERSWYTVGAANIEDYTETNFLKHISGVFAMLARCDWTVWKGDLNLFGAKRRGPNQAGRYCPIRPARRC